MPTVAEQLRAAREKQNLSVQELAEITKIKPQYVLDLEEGNYDAFSAPVYIRGFVRNYAGAVRLDVPETMAALEAELAQTEKFREPPSLIPAQRGPLDYIMLQLSRLNWRVVGAVVVLSGITLGGLWGYRTWQAHRVKDPLAGLGPGVYQERSNQTQEGELLPLTNTPGQR